MKFVWEEKDIVQGDKFGSLEDDVVYMFGVCQEIAPYRKDGANYVMINLSNGVVGPAYDKEKLAEMMNACGYTPSKFLEVM